MGERLADELERLQEELAEAHAACSRWANVADEMARVLGDPTTTEHVALAAAEPCDPPGALPLAFRAPAETSRALPNGRGFLRVISGGKGAPAAAPPEVSPPAPAAPTSAVDSSTAQLDLLTWQPRNKSLPPPGMQLSLFGYEL